MYDKIIDTYLNLGDDRYEDCLTYLDYLTNTSISDNARKGQIVKAQIVKAYYDEYAKYDNDQLNKKVIDTTKNNKRYILIRL